MELEAVSSYTNSIYSTKAFLWLLFLIITLSLGNYVAAVTIFPPFRNLFTSSPLMGRLKKELKRTTLLLLVYLCVALTYAFSGASILSLILETGDTKEYVITSMIVGIAIASIARTLAASGLKSVIIMLYYQIVFTMSTLTLFWFGPQEFLRRNIFNSIHLVVLKMIEEGYIELIILLLFFVFCFTESILRRIKLSKIRSLQPIKEYAGNQQNLCKSKSPNI